jgi:hypothetical protein
MYLLLISLLTILTGVLLLAKFRKEGLGKFFIYVSWFFVVVGFILFIGFISGAAIRLSHPGYPGGPRFRHEMMMKGHPQGMIRGGFRYGAPINGNCCPGMLKGGECCKGGMMAGKSCGNMNCMKTDSLSKVCPAHAVIDSVKHK